MSYWLHPDAEAELGDAAVYYAEHANRAVSNCASGQQAADEFGVLTELAVQRSQLCIKFDSRRDDDPVERIAMAFGQHHCA